MQFCAFTQSGQDRTSLISVFFTTKKISQAPSTLLKWLLLVFFCLSVSSQANIAALLVGVGGAACWLAPL